MMKFYSRFVFHFLTKIQLEKNITWFYNERGHGKGPVDGIVGTVKTQEGKIWSLCNRYTLTVCPTKSVNPLLHYTSSESEICEK